MLQLTYQYGTWYHTSMDTSTERKTQRWMLYVPPALLEQFRTLSAAHRRSLNSELVWALEQYAKLERRKRSRDADAQGV
jgi:Arc-like DNA binding domain